MTDMQIHARGAVEGSAILALAGEIDMANANEVEAELYVYVASTTGDVRLDCVALEFLDSSGLEMLTTIQRELAEEGRSLVLTRTRPFIRQLLEITELHRVLIVD